MDGLIKEETQAKETKKEPLREGVEWISECIDIKQLFRIKGKQGLYIPISKTSKSGLIRMERLLSKEAYIVNRILLEGLDGIVIYKDDTSTISLAEAFDNMQKKYDNEIWNRKLNYLGMNIICPDFDMDRFKLYHAKKIIQWYNEIINSIKVPYGKTA